MRSNQRCRFDDIDVFVCITGILPFVVKAYNPFICISYIIPYQGDYMPVEIRLPAL